MAITTQFLTGWEHGFIGTGYNAGGGLGGATLGAGFSASTSSPRNGGYCCHLVAPANTGMRMTMPPLTWGAKVVARLGIKVSSRPSSGVVMLLAGSNSVGGTSYAFTISSAGVLAAQVGTGTVQNGATIDATGWHVLEFQLDSVARTLDWKVDGVAQPRATGSAASDLATFFLGTISTVQAAFTADYDDLIVGNWVTAATDWYGDGKVIRQFPNNDGTHNIITSLSSGDAGAAYSGTPNTIWAQLDDSPGAGGWTANRTTTDNVALRVATVAAYAEIKASAPFPEPGVANAVRAIMSYSSPAAQANLAACDVRNSDNVVTELWGLTGGVGKAYNVIANNFKAAIVPAPAAGWTAAEVNVIRFRFGGCVSADISPVPTIQALMLEVDWPLVPAAPANTDAPALSGLAVVGSTLTCSTGNWSGFPTPTYAYQWYRGATPIGGATSSTYLLVAGDAGQSVTCQVTATNSQGSATQASAAITPIAPNETVIDDFNRADGNIAVGGPWVSKLVDAATATDLRVISNRLGSAIDAVIQSAYTTTAVEGGDCDIVFDVGVVATGGLTLYCLLNNPGSPAFSAYTVNFSGSNTYNLIRVVAGAPTGLATGVPLTLAAGDTLWFSKRAGAIKLYRKPSGGIYTLINSVTDPSPHSPASGVVAIEMADTTARIDNLRGGPIVAAGITYNDSRSGTVIASGSGTESRVYTDSRSGTITANGYGVYSLSTLTDDFSTLDTTKWTPVGLPSPFVSSGQLHIPRSTDFPYIWTKSRYEISGSEVFVEVVQANTTIADAETDFYLYRDLSNVVWMGVYVWGAGDARLEMWYRAANVQETPAPYVPYDPVQHRWWRIRGQGGNVYWDTSPDGATWNNQRVAAWPLSTTIVQPTLMAGYATLTASDDAIFDNFNIPGVPSGPTYNDSGSGTVTATGSGIESYVSAYASIILADNPAGYWHLNDLTDSSGHGLTLTQTGTVTDVAGIVVSESGAKQFLTDFNADGLRRADEALLRHSTTFTVEAWVKPAFVGDVEFNVIQKDQQYILYMLPSGVFRMEFFTSSGFFHADSTTIAVVGTTYHLVGVLDSGVVKLYVNSVLEGTTSCPGTPTVNANAFCIGSDPGINAGWWGVVDEPAIYQLVLSPTEIQEHYSAGSGITFVTNNDSGTGTVTASGTGSDAYVYTDSGSGTITASGTGTDARVYPDSGTGTITGTGTGSDSSVYADTRAGTIAVSGTSSESSVYTDSGSGTITASGNRVEQATYADISSGTVIASGIGTESYSYTDSGSGTLTASGSGTEANSYADIRSGTITASGSGVESYQITYVDSGLGTVTASGIGSESHQVVYFDSGSGTATASGSGSESYQVASAYTDSGSGTITASGSGVESYQPTYTDTASGTVTVSGSGSESYSKIDSGSGTIASSGTGTESSSYADSGSGTANASGTGSDTRVYPDANTGTITVTGTGSDNRAYTDTSVGTIAGTGTGTDSSVYADAGIGTITAIGTDVEACVYTDTGTGAIVVSGTSTESTSHTASAIGTATASGTSAETASHSASATGAIVVTGTGADSQVYNDARSGTALVSGTGVDSSDILITYVDARSGQITVSGTSIESQSHTSTATGTVSVSGTSVESHSHSSTTTGTVSTVGTSSESQSHTSTATGFVFVDGTGLETYNVSTIYTDTSEGSITSTGTGVDSVSYSDAATGTITSTGTSIDSAFYSNTAVGTITLLGSGTEGYSYTDASTGIIVITGTGREVGDHTQPTPFSTIIALDRFNIAVWNKASIHSVVTSTAPISVQVALQRTVKVDVTKRNGTKVLVKLK